MPSQLQVPRIPAAQEPQAWPGQSGHPDGGPEPVPACAVTMGQARGAGRHAGWELGAPCRHSGRGSNACETPPPQCHYKRSKPSSSGHRLGRQCSEPGGAQEPKCRGVAPLTCLSVPSQGNHVWARGLNPGSACLPCPASNSKDRLSGPRRGALRSYPGPRGFSKAV